MNSWCNYTVNMKMFTESGIPNIVSVNQKYNNDM